MTFWDGDVSVPKQYFVSLLLLSPKFSWGSVFLAAVVSLLSVLLVTATGNRLFLPVLQAFMHRKAVEHLSQLCYLNPNIPVSMQFIPIFFSDDSCCFLISCCVLCMFVGSVPRAECQAAIWPCPKWAEQDLLKALFPGTHLPRCCCFALVQCHWFCWQCTLIPHWAELLLSWLLSITQQGNCSFLPEPPALHLSLNSTLWLRAFQPLLPPKNFVTYCRGWFCNVAFTRIN